MSDQYSEQAKADFQKARFKAFMNRAWGSLSGQRTTLLSYDEIKEKLHIGGPIYRGIKTVRVDQIAGSLNRYHEFDRVFLPASDTLAERWQRVNRAFYQEISLPPVVLYKVGQVYFVVDGHHRVSVAREQGQIEPQAMLEHLIAAGLSRFDMPEYFIVMPAFPLTASGKILKRELLNWVASGRITPRSVHWIDPAKET